MKTIFLSILIFLFLSCKSRKSEVEKLTEKAQVKTETKVTDKTETENKFTDKSEIKTETKTTITDSTETKTTKKTTFFKPDSTTPPNSVKEITEETTTKRKTKENGKKLENKKVDIFADHSEIKNIDLNSKSDSTGAKKEITKITESKSNTLQVWIGAGLFFVIVGIGLIAYNKMKP